MVSTDSCYKLFGNKKRCALVLACEEKTVSFELQRYHRGLEKTFKDSSETQRSALLQCIKVQHLIVAANDTLE